MSRSEKNKIRKSDPGTEAPDTYLWKRSYTLVLLFNALYIAIFYFLMTLFS